MRTKLYKILFLSLSLSIYTRYNVNDNQFKRFEMIIATMTMATTATVSVVIASKVKINMLFLCIAVLPPSLPLLLLTDSKSDLSDICCRQMKTIHQNVNKHIDTIKKIVYIDTRSYANFTLVKIKWSE